MTSDLRAHPGFAASFNAARGLRSYTAGQFITAFWSRVEEGSGGCLLWTGSTGGKYGTASLAGRTVGAHRISVWMATGEVVPPDMQVDHLCKVPLCVNPDHLEVVTPAENNRRSDSPTAINARRTHCVKGHEFTEANTQWKRSGTRRDCRTCHRERMRKAS